MNEKVTGNLGMNLIGIKQENKGEGDTCNWTKANHNCCRPEGMEEDEEKNSPSAASALIDPIFHPFTPFT